jgi:hypothetical protein
MSEYAMQWYINIAIRDSIPFSYVYIPELADYR